jgi:Tfp pilus assembly PilM family ATPase
MGVFDGDGGLKAVEFSRLPGEPGKLAALLSGWVVKHHLEGKPAFTCISDPKISIQYMSFPGISKKELPSAVRMEAAQIFGPDLAHMDFDFSAHCRKRNTGNLLFVAIPRNLSEKRISLLDSAGLKPRGLTLAGIALANGYISAANRDNDPKPTLLLNIGHRTSNLAIILGDEICFIRDIFWGIENMAAEIAVAAGLDAAGALRLMENGEYARLPLQSVFNGTVNILIEELLKTITYSGDILKVRAENLVVTGGGSRIPSMPEHLAERLFLKLKPYRSLKAGELHKAQQQLDPFCAVIAGLSKNKL